jgi:NhaP-type Na+/H+ or K+/H+ antiporter
VFCEKAVEVTNNSQLRPGGLVSAKIKLIGVGESCILRTMILGIAEVILAGMVFEWVANKLKAPGLLGLLLLGLVAGPFALNLIDPGLYAVGADLRIVALVVILFRAGFEMNRQQLAAVGVRAVLMSFVPCLCETAAVAFFAPLVLPLTFHEAALLGAVLAAVSPAVIVPYMIQFNREGRGTDKGIPTLILAGASCDDAVAIVLCTSFTAAYVGHASEITAQLATIPVSVLTGIGFGLAAGYGLHLLFKHANPRATKRLLVLLAVAIVLTQAQPWVEGYVPYSALMSIMAIGVMIYELEVRAAQEMSEKLGKLWIFAQLLLFVLVGAQVNVGLAWSVGLAGAGVILVGLVGRSLGVCLCLLSSNLTAKERLFVVFAYFPKATVQAAIGASPLVAMTAAGMSTAPGEVILAVAVLSILLTAPLGAALISFTGKRLLRVVPPAGA